MRLSQPTLDDSEMEAVREVLQSGYLTQGSKAQQFEAEVARYVGTQFGIATSSCTTGLHMILAALEIGPGDEVIVPDFTFPATANVVAQCGARPVLVDIDTKTWTVTADAVRAAISPRTRAVMPVHVFGLCADVPAVNDLAQQTKLTVIEDAATALGSEIHGARAGSLGDAACFSFHPRKIITTGEGGVITTNDAELGRRMSILRSHGAVKDEHYLSFVNAGFNYRLSDVHSAIGLVQMMRLEDIVESRRQLACDYAAELARIDEVEMQHVPAGYRHTYQSLVVMLADSVDRNQVICEMKTQGVETTLGTYAMHCQPFFEQQGFSCGDLPNSARAFKQSLTLPLIPNMTQEDIGHVTSCLKRSILQAG